MSWEVHLARKHPGRLAISLAFVFFASAAGYAVVGVSAAVLVALVMIASLIDFLLPVKYEITRDGASCRMLHKRSDIRWENVRRVYLDDLGIKISPLRRRTRLEAFRGVYLRYADNRDQVIEAVKLMRQGGGEKCSE